MKVVLFGSPEFAIPTLEALYNSDDNELLCVVTQCDKPVGRKKIMTPPPLKKRALELNVPVYQSDRINSEESLDYLRSLNADIFVTAAYGQILRQPLLDIAEHGVINVHASLLPKYRGAAPIAWSIKCGEKVTGVTIMHTDVGVDTGDIIIQREVEIEAEDTTATLTSKLAVCGSSLLIEALDLLSKDEAPRIEQDHEIATKTPMLKKTHGLIDFSMSFNEIDCLVRAMDPWPGTYTVFMGKKLSVFKVEKVECSTDVIPGTSIENLVIKCSDAAVRLCEVQLEGSKRMTDVDFLRGRKVESGTYFGQEDNA